MLDSQTLAMMAEGTGATLYMTFARIRWFTGYWT